MMDRYVRNLVQAGELLKAGDVTTARALLEDCVAADNDNPMALALLGVAHQHNGEIGTALTLLKKACHIRKDVDITWHNLGVAYHHARIKDKARECYRKALDLKPDRADTMSMLAGLAIETGRQGEGIEWADRALELEPDNPHALTHKALLLLELGDWKNGWELYHGNRWRVPERAKDKRDFGDIPEWDGSPVDCLAIHGEQGLGDELLLMQAVSDHPNSVNDVVVECNKRLIPLLRRSYPWATYYPNHAELMTHEKPDAWIAMGDLPRMGIKLGMNAPGIYRRNPLCADMTRMNALRERAKIDPRKPLVGLAWWGGFGHGRGQRNAPLDHWKAFVEAFPGQCISLQYTVGSKEEADEMGIPHWQDVIDDFDDLTALIAACDGVVSVLQTAVHQAGGLGIPCWALAPKNPPWQFCGDSADCLWYPSVKILRQREAGDWKPVFVDALDSVNAHFGIVSKSEPQAA